MKGMKGPDLAAEALEGGWNPEHVAQARSTPHTAVLSHLLLTEAETVKETTRVLIVAMVVEAQTIWKGVYQTCPLLS